MTTGRINQVTNFQKSKPERRPLRRKVIAVAFPSAGVRRRSEGPIPKARATETSPHFPEVLAGRAIHGQSPPCSLDLTKFKRTSPCPPKGQRSWPSVRTTSDRRRLNGARSRGGSPSG